MSFCYEYPRPAVTTDAILFYRVESTFYFLLIERGIEPFKGSWALPGGFVNMDEELDTACSRELLEETGITVQNLTQFKTYGTLNRDPRGRTISTVFYKELKAHIDPKSGDDASNARWFDSKNLPNLAFDHQKIIEQFLNEFLKTA